MKLIKNFIRLIVYSGLMIFASLQARDLYYSHTGTNGFDLIAPLIPKERIYQGGPPKDGIPAIDHPRFLKETEIKAASLDERVLGIFYNGVAKAYPISILNWHEIINDEFNGKKISITFCPLCGTGMAFDTNDIGHLGVSGLLYNSDMLLYDRKTESLWSQIMATSISGKLKGDKLKSIPLIYSTLGGWRSTHQDSLLLSKDTGYSRNYDESPYIGYATSNTQYFPTSYTDNRYQKKEPVIGLNLRNKQKVWPLVELNKTKLPLNDQIGDQKITIHYDEKSDMAWITDEKNQLLPAVRGFWFAWIAFYPNTDVFSVFKTNDLNSK